MSVQTIDVSTAARKKPAGGFHFVSVVELASAWWAYSEGLIRIADLRVWFACHEANARRCGGKGRGEPRFNLDEIRGLTGVPVSKLRGSIKRLEAAGLLSWSESALSFGDGSRPGRRASPRSSPSSRTTLGGSRSLAASCGSSPAVPARPSSPASSGTCSAASTTERARSSRRGRCKASWIADDVRRLAPSREGSSGRAAPARLAHPRSGPPMGPQSLGGMGLD